MKIGEVKFFLDSKGYGFIKDEDKTEFFFHFSEVRAEDRTLRSLDSVEFEIGEDKNGRPSAVNIKRI